MLLVASSFLAFVFGLVFGSFFNVCIHRLPREQSIVRPRSHCPSCRKSIQWYDNVPLLSYLILRGRCRHCKARISPRYFLIELLTGLGFLWVWLYSGWSFATVIALPLFSLLLVATVVDLEHQIIPDEVSLGGLVLGLMLSGFIPEIHGRLNWNWGLSDSLLGAVVGGGAIYLTGVIGTLIFKKDAMGGGDVKLMAMLGAFLGWEKVTLVYLMAPILALPMGLTVKLAKRAEVIPFGPFLSLAGWIAFLWGDRLIAWYWSGM